MDIVAGDDAGTERIEVEVTPQAKAILTAAARARHTTVGDFLLVHGIEAAERTATDPRVFFASDEGWAEINRLLDGPDAPPSPAAVEWVARGRQAE